MRSERCSPLPMLFGLGGSGTVMSRLIGTAAPATIGARMLWFDRLVGTQNVPCAVGTGSQRGTHQRITGRSMLIAGRKERVTDATSLISAVGCRWVIPQTPSGLT